MYVKKTSFYKIVLNYILQKIKQKLHVVNKGNKYTVTEKYIKMISDIAKKNKKNNNNAAHSQRERITNYKLMIPSAYMKSLPLFKISKNLQPLKYDSTSFIFILHDKTIVL